MLEIKNLKAGYFGNLPINNLSFSLPDNSFLAIIGHNGSGKSTLLKAITNQIPFEGDIFINNISLKKYGHKRLISTLNQQNNLKFSIIVKELVVMGKFSQKTFFEEYDDHDFMNVEEVLESLNISHLANKDFTKLSGGEQQMVWLAQMMVQNSEYFLLDEPTQSLDVYNKRKVFDLIERWVVDYHKTVLCITHDLQNLRKIKGYLINISKENPYLEVISIETVEENTYFLESNPLRQKY